MSLCGCGGCGEIFTSLSAFDYHQDRDYTRRPPVICRPPAEAGLIQDNDGRWRVPLSASGARRLANLRAERARGIPE